MAEHPLYDALPALLPQVLSFLFGRVCRMELRTQVSGNADSERIQRSKGLCLESNWLRAYLVEPKRRVQCRQAWS